MCQYALPNTSTETVHRKLIFTKFTCSTKKVTVCHSDAYSRKEALVSLKLCCLLKTDGLRYTEFPTELYVSLDDAKPRDS